MCLVLCKIAVRCGLVLDRGLIICNGSMGGGGGVSYGMHDSASLLLGMW